MIFNHLQLLDFECRSTCGAVSTFFMHEQHGSLWPGLFIQKSSRTICQVLMCHLAFVIFIMKNNWEISRKVKSSMARSLPVENLLPQNVGSIINYLQ